MTWEGHVMVHCTLTVNIDATGGKSIKSAYPVGFTMENDRAVFVVYLFYCRDLNVINRMVR